MSRDPAGVGEQEGVACLPEAIAYGGVAGIACDVWDVFALDLRLLSGSCTAKNGGGYEHRDMRFQFHRSPLSG